MKQLARMDNVLQDPACVMETEIAVMVLMRTFVEVNRS
jgi:hypothetical protein